MNPLHRLAPGAIPFISRLACQDRLAATQQSVRPGVPLLTLIHHFERVIEPLRPGQALGFRDDL